MVTGILAAAAAMASAPLTAEEYADPSGQVVLPDGRVMQLTCRGAESDFTIILLAGLGDWSMTWSAIHQDFAGYARTCALDRPGFGMSGAGSGGRLTDLVSDYRAALVSAGIGGPLILAGHSFGGLEALRWADDHPEEIGGLLLIDNSVPRQIEIAVEQVPVVGKVMQAMFARSEQSDRECAARGGDLSDAPADDACLLSAVRPGLSEAVAGPMRELARDPDRFERRAEMLAGFANTTELPFSEDLGEIPVITLIAGENTRLPPGFPEDVRLAAPLFDQVMVEERTRVTSWSSNGEARIVPGAGHRVHLDRPDAVRAAMAQLVWKVEQTASGATD